MKYITHRRFKGHAICGDVNIPAKTEVECANGVLLWNGKALCYDTSENAHQYFARNDDGMGMTRGNLTQAILKRLAKPSSPTHDRQKLWDKVWEDKVCRKYKRKEHQDHWLWDHEWYQADIETLRYIAKLVGAKEG